MHESTFEFIVLEMRNRFRAGASLVSILSWLHSQIPVEQGIHMTMVRCMRDAFFLSLAEASPICGWEPNGAGELSDEGLTALVEPAIESHCGQW